MPEDEEILEALAELTDALRQNTERNEQVLKRAEDLRRRRSQGIRWSELVTDEERPLIVEMLTQNMHVLTSAGARLRRLEAKALHDEGVTMERIAQLFGVSRQRISELLREHA